MSQPPRTLSEHDSKALLGAFGIPLAREVLAITPDEAAAAGARIGFPVVAKLCGDAIAHKTERGLVRLGLADAAALEAAYRFCERARNARYLRSGSPSDALPSDRAELERLGLMLGYVHQPATSLRDDYRRVTRRARRAAIRCAHVVPGECLCQRKGRPVVAAASAVRGVLQ